eukprot:TRINITY_DN67214_c0_g1_i1.p1 TRINITY_DN67214_c0_g1~~TRINITY_DN67214_c0_g1_i1.p1  ORF type:complete len:237 (+),score=68.53 TRINITY_DN67214_c0_g1_i1:151-861(+)
MAVSPRHIEPEDERPVLEDLCETIRAAAEQGETTFNFSQNHVVSRFPAEIKLMKKTLTVLHVDNNYQLRQLPPSIGDLTHLSWLNVSYNRLAELPPEIGRLHNLTRLHCNNNLLTALPLEVWNLKKLVELQADSNQLKAVPTGVLEMPQLTTLYLDNNPLLKPEDLADGALEEKAPPPPPVGDCSLTRQKFTKCFVHMSFHDLCGLTQVPVVHYLATAKALELLKISLFEKYGVAS